MKIYTKESLIEALREIRAKGWIENKRHGNAGSVGNTLEDLLGITENNLPLANAAEWELKAQRKNTDSLITLFHLEPSPTALKFISTILLPVYGWPHQEAGKKHSKATVSFRQTIHALEVSDRGFSVEVDRQAEKVSITFDLTKISAKHATWQQR